MSTSHATKLAIEAVERADAAAEAGTSSPLRAQALYKAAAKQVLAVMKDPANAARLEKLRAIAARCVDKAEELAAEAKRVQLESEAKWSAARLRESAEHKRQTFEMLRTSAAQLNWKVDEHQLQKIENDAADSERRAAAAEEREAFARAQPQPETEPEPAPEPTGPGTEPEPEPEPTEPQPATAEEGVPPAPKMTTEEARLRLTRIYKAHGVKRDIDKTLRDWVAKHGKGTESELIAGAESKYGATVKVPKHGAKVSTAPKKPQKQKPSGGGKKPEKTQASKEKKFKPAVKADEEMVLAIEQIRREGGAGGLGFDDIFGIEKAKSILFKAVNLPIIAPHFYRPHPDGVLDPYNGILLFGPPGTGKTALAKAVAAQCKCSFFNVSTSTLEHKWKGDSVKTVKLIFEMARFYSPSVIFIDEVDRTLQGEHESSGKMRGEVLTQMQGAREDSGERVMVLAGSNYPWKIEMALLSRFEIKIHIPLPGVAGIRQMLETDMSVAEDVDLDRWATHMAAPGQNYSGRDIAACVKMAKTMAMDRWQGDRSQQEIAALKLSRDDLRVTNADLAEVVRCVHGSAGVRQEDWQRYKDWDEGNSSVAA